MEDPTLNRNLDETKELQTRWSQFHDFVVMAMQQGPKKITPQAEMKFLELKSRIAMLHDSFMSSLKHEQKVGQNIIAIVSDIILLKRTANASEAERQKFEFDWNECYMLLTEQASALDEEKKRLAGVNERAFKSAQRFGLIKARVYNFLHGAGLKYGTILTLILMAVWIVPDYLWTYDNLYDNQITRPLYVKFVRFIYRPFLDHDKKYFNLNDVERDPDNKPTENKAIRETEKPSLTYFHSILPALGIDQNGLAEAQKLLDDNGGVSYESEGYDADNVPVKLFYLMFKETETAKRFIELCRTGLNSYPPDQQKKIRAMTFIAHRANFVVIGISDHGMRESQPREKWLFGKITPNELGQ